MFLYFIPTPQTTRCDHAMLAEYMLDSVIDTPVTCPVASGPDGDKGIVIVDNSLSAVPVPYQPQTQSWRKSLDTDAWIGYLGSTPPRCASLARENMLPGKPLKLSTGETIVIPIARRHIIADEQIYRTVALPRAMGRNPETKAWEPRSVVATYASLWNLLAGYLEAQEQAVRNSDSADTSVWFDYAPIHDLIVAAIGANYRIAHDEIEQLGIYDQSLQGPIIDILTDESTRQAWLKKKLRDLTSAGATSSAGPAPSTPASN
ncbi:hypothetical protein [Roseiconus lacunae]|uniref:Uncharacterized protein n=1 Tax=Roseiconus lacunae TaxID=2605694 RepID=A0ABT7PHU4_9BACT|nr:hypothetical protein [Roseiconus lacunae]MDM4015859.1 hypothetical protein [Roseiconus lacunae]